MYREKNDVPIRFNIVLFMVVILWEREIDTVKMYLFFNQLNVNHLMFLISFCQAATNAFSCNDHIMSDFF